MSPARFSSFCYFQSHTGWMRRGTDRMWFAGETAFKEYTKAIDMWSVGCILAEMSESPGFAEAVFVGMRRQEES